MSVRNVSILILMDIALKDERYSRLVQKATRFNPYSDGYCSESWKVIKENPNLIFVSILILMDIALKVHTTGTATENHCGFNPYSDGYCSESWYAQFL